MYVSNNMKKVVMWITVSVIVVIGLFITKNANCLWGFLIPALLG